MRRTPGRRTNGSISGQTIVTIYAREPAPFVLSMFSTWTHHHRIRVAQSTGRHRLRVGTIQGIAIPFPELRGPGHLPGKPILVRWHQRVSRRASDLLDGSILVEDVPHLLAIAAEPAVVDNLQLRVTDNLESGRDLRRIVQRGCHGVEPAAEVHDIGVSPQRRE